MKREYKFRAWNPNIRMWVSFEFFIGDKNVGLEQYDPNLIIQQYTGTKDKNGVDIYEGDVISCYEYMGHGAEDYMRKFSVVVWDGYSWCYSLDKTRNWKNPHQILRFARNLEVIGNICETPNV